jgi:hypothetical protein
VISEHLLDMFRKGKKSFMDRYVTIDETWIHDYDPETKVKVKSGDIPVLLRRENLRLFLLQEKF